MRTIIYMYTYTRRARIILINIFFGGGGSLIKKILTFTSIYYIPPPFLRKKNWGSTNSIIIQFGEMHKIYLHIYTRIVIYYSLCIARRSQMMSKMFINTCIEII